MLSELASEASPQPLLRVFEKHLLEAIGYAMLLDREYESGDEIHPDHWYDYQPQRGPVPCPGSKSDRISGAALLALHAENLQSEHLPELRMLMRGVIGYHLGDRPLASLSLFST